jgi:purine-binding chemotaxis protein CheW
MNQSPKLRNSLSRELLKTRARMLARPLAEDSERRLAYQVVAFGVSGNRLAVETRLTEEVFQIKDLTPVPKMPDYVLGLTNLRGHIISVLSLSRLLGLEGSTVSRPEKPVAREERETIAVLVKFGALKLALAVDELLGVRDVDYVELSENSTCLSERLAGLCLAITTDRLIILDAKRLFKDSMIASLSG